MKREGEQGLKSQFHIWKTFQFLSSFKKWKQFIVSLSRAFLWLSDNSDQLISFSKSAVSHCAYNRVVKFTCGSYVVICKCIVSVGVQCVSSHTYPSTRMLVSHTWNSQQRPPSKVSRRSPLLLEMLKKWSVFLVRTATDET